MARGRVLAEGRRGHGLVRECVQGEAELGARVREGDDVDGADVGGAEDGELVVDEGPAHDRERALGHRLRQREHAAAGAPCEDDRLHFLHAVVGRHAGCGAARVGSVQCAAGSGHFSLAAPMSASILDKTALRRAKRPGSLQGMQERRRERLRAMQATRRRDMVQRVREMARSAAQEGENAFQAAKQAESAPAAHPVASGAGAAGGPGVDAGDAGAAGGDGKQEQAARRRRAFQKQLAQRREWAMSMAHPEVRAAAAAAVPLSGTDPAPPWSPPGSG